MRLIFLCILAFAAGAALLRAQDTGSVRTADGFQCPVGPNGTGEGYYIARGYIPNGHLGDDWNGVKGGDTDLGDPVYTVAHGLVVFAKNYHVGWGNVVIIRHAYYDGLSLKYVDSLYGHLDSFSVQEGQQVRRGQQIGTIGNNRGMYDAHLHFEMRKNLAIGMYRSSFPRDHSNYWSPNRFIAAHLTCRSGGKLVSVPVNTFPANAPPSYVAGKVSTPVYTPTTAPASHLPPVAAGARRLPSGPEPEIYTPTSPSKATASKTAGATKSPPTDSASAKSAKSDKTAKTAPKDGQKIAKAESDEQPDEPAVLTDAYEAGLPPLPAGSPIRRSGPTFRVDRFQDLRGTGY